MTSQRDRGSERARAAAAWALVSVCMSVSAVACGPGSPALRPAASATANVRLDEAIDTVSEVQRALPPWVTSLTRCIAVFPALDGHPSLHTNPRAGFAACRAGASWTSPAPMSLSGDNAQVGRASSDLLVLVMTDPAMEKLLRTKLHVGSDVSSAAGIVGAAGRDRKSVV